MTESLVHDLWIVLAAGLAASLICKQLQVSVLVGYLLVGTIVGKGCLGWVVDESHQIEHIAEAGVFLLLFSIGLEFSLDELVRLGRHLLIGGAAQMLLVAIPVMAALSSAGFAWQAAVLTGSAAAFSSTVLVFKALSEWGHSNLPHGRRAIGVLLFQDAALIPLLLLAPALTQGVASANWSHYAVLAAKSALFIAAVVVSRRLLQKTVIPAFASYRSLDTLILFTLVLLGLVTLAAYWISLPPAIGAFAAGLILSGNRWTHQIDALILPFRETFAAVFFVSLGLLFNPQLYWQEPMLMLALLATLIVLKAFAATAALWLTGLRFWPAAGMGIGLAHVGEFAFVLAMLGLEIEILGELEYQRVVAIAIGSLFISPILLKAGLRWTVVEPVSPEQRIGPSREPMQSRAAIVVGAGPVGRQVCSHLETLGRDTCLVDLSPVNIHAFAQAGFRTVAGDGTDFSTLELAGAKAASIVVVCVPDDEVAARIVRSIRQLNLSCELVVRSRYASNLALLVKAGADRIVSEDTEAAHALVRNLTELDDLASS